MSTTVTEALVLAHQGAPFVRTQVTLCAPAENEVLVRIVASGLCHTDLALQAGEFPTAFPSIAGESLKSLQHAAASSAAVVWGGEGRRRKGLMLSMRVQGTKELVLSRLLARM